MASQPTTDELTGLATQREMLAALDRELDRRGPFKRPLGLVVLEVDGLEQTNDAYGHQQGDQVLVEVSRVLCALTRDYDEPTHQGGEEFAVVLPETDLDGAAVVAERARKAIERLRIPHVEGDGEVHVTASFGAASMPATTTDRERLVEAAEGALLRAKRAGTNRVERAA